MKKPKPEIHAGDRFGRLTVVEIWDRQPGRGLRWLCRCSCGGWSITSPYRLLSGAAQSCGCKKIQAFTAMLEKEHRRRAQVAALVEARLGLDDL